MPRDDGAPGAMYRTRGEGFARAAAAVGARWSRVANARLLVSLAAAAALGAGLWQGLPPLVGVGGLLCLVFAGLVVYHVRLGRELRRLELLAAINREALARPAREWSGVPLRHRVRAPEAHAYAADLDLFGRASLMHLLDTVSTSFGERTLASWLLAPAPPAEVAARQAVAAELAPNLEFREELRLRGAAIGPDRPDPDRFLDWAESARLLPRRGTALAVARVSPPLLLALLAAQIAGLTPYPLWLAFLLLNGVVMALVVGEAAARLGAAASQERRFRVYADAFALIEATPIEALALRAIHGDLAAEGRPAHAWLRRLHTLTRFVVPPSALFHVPLQLLLLYDLHLLWLVERWQGRAGSRVRGWLGALGRAEALAALGTLAFDNPDWAWPALDPRAEMLSGRALGHPLLDLAGRVTNDVVVEPPGTFLLVTGSNMSGKSTLLRLIGANAVLAAAGAPVCAAALRLPPLQVWTSMRVSDSLERGVSHFMAEIQRLKQVVDAARAVAGPPGEPPRLLYLLDEILQGTNSAERRVAARRILRFLVATGTIGVVSTHDLDLIASDELATAAHAGHFTETVESDHPDGALRFDYRILPGLARSTNALKLMALIGLGECEIGGDATRDP